MELEQLKVVALSDANEDVYGLYELVWYLNHREPKTPVFEKIAAASEALSALLESGLIEVHRLTWPDRDGLVLTPTEAATVLKAASSFSPPSPDDAGYFAFAATLAGLAAYRQLPAAAFKGLW